MSISKNYIVLVDLDDVLDDLLPAWVSKINELYSLNVDYKDIVEWDMKKAFPSLSTEEIYAPLLIEDFWKDVKPVENSIMYFQTLYEEGYNIKICTASCPTAIHYKYKHFIQKYLPFITYKDIICIYDKQLILGNVLLDDNINNLIGGKYTGVLFNRNYNKNIKTKIKRVDNWEEFYNFVHEDYKKWLKK